MSSAGRSHVYAVENALEGAASEQMMAVGRRIYERGMNVSLDGNLSIRMDSGRILLTRSGAHKGYLKREDCIVVDLAGRVLEGSGRASSEFAMHSQIYGQRADVGAVIHAHAPYALACSLAGIDLARLWISIPPIPTTAYARPASEDSAKVLEPYIDKYFWAILPRHGAVCWGENIWEAFCRMEALEHTAKIVLSAHSANADCDVMDKAQEKELFELWGG
ncbi:MAG: class II aldolase/adducin family protein [Bradymonadales bacterium]|jgi:L-fuculose-phosphate aldolase